MGDGRRRRVINQLARCARQIGWPVVARRPFLTPDALVVVSTDGYFDVFPPVERTPNDKPAYRGRIAELGSTVRRPDGRLSVRPDSVVLDEAVMAWSARHGAAAVRGEMGLRREESPEPSASNAA